MTVEGKEAVKSIQKIVGALNVVDATQGTIRGNMLLK